MPLEAAQVRSWSTKLSEAGYGTAPAVAETQEQLHYVCVVEVRSGGGSGEAPPLGRLL